MGEIAANKSELTRQGKDKPIAAEPRSLAENAAPSNYGIRPMLWYDIGLSD